MTIQLYLLTDGVMTAEGVELRVIRGNKRKLAPVVANIYGC